MTAIIRGSETTDEYHERIRVMMQDEAAKPDVDAETSAGGVEPVAWLAEDHGAGPRITRLPRMAEIWTAQGLKVEPLYKRFVPSATSERKDIKRLRADNERLTKERDALRAAIFGAFNYSPDLRHENFVEMASMTEAARIGAIARAEAAEAKLAALSTQPAPAGTSGAPGSQEADPLGPARLVAEHVMQMTFLSGAGHLAKKLAMKALAGKTGGA